MLYNVYVSVLRIKALAPCSASTTASTSKTLYSHIKWMSVVLSTRDLMSWINGIRGLVSSDELAKDVTGGEALLERHQVLNGMKKHPNSQIIIFIFFKLYCSIHLFLSIT